MFHVVEITSGIEAQVQIYDLTALKRMKIKDLVDADIVLVSFQFFFSSSYQRRVDKAVFEVDGSLGWKLGVHVRDLSKVILKYYSMRS